MLEVKLPTFNDTVFCIDEPELHLSTAIQRKLLTELADMIPENCQLWVATHSIGFLRALQQDLGDDSQILDFSERDYFHGDHTITPIRGTRADWQRIFSTALEDLTGLLAPETIIYCEGREDPDAGGEEQGLDAKVYSTIFEANAGALFVSSGGGGAQRKHSSLALKVLSKAFRGVALRLLKDRDDFTDDQRAGFLAESPEHRMLHRREIENYLFDREILILYTQKNGVQLDDTLYDQLVTDINHQDLKVGQTLQRLASFCGFRSTVQEFKLALASCVAPETATYSALRACVFEE